MTNDDILETSTSGHYEKALLAYLFTDHAGFVPPEDNTVYLAGTGVSLSAPASTLKAALKKKPTKANKKLAERQAKEAKAKENAEKANAKKAKVIAG